MNRKFFVLALVFILGACKSAPPDRPRLEAQSSPSVASQSTSRSTLTYVATGRLADVADFAKKLPSATSLVVFDIDDTLLSTPFITGTSGPRRFFGSDAWYNWQVSLKGALPHATPCLYDFLAINYEVETQPATEGAEATVKSISADKLLLTSRNPDYRSGTERELKEARLFPIKQLTMNPNVFIRTPEGVPMTYLNGVYMTKGANKGEALFALLEELGIEHKYSDIVLVDDGWKNILNMNASVSGRDINFHGFLYTGIKVDPLTIGETNFDPGADMIRDADEAWTVWLESLGKAYPKRKERFDAKACTK